MTALASRLLAEVRGAVARGWCAPANSMKVMDTDLAEAIAQEVCALMQAEAAAALSGREAVAWTHDAENWGNALNDAGWEFLEHCPEKSVLLFNSAKPALRMAILKYAASVAAAPSAKGVAE